MVTRMTRAKPWTLQNCQRAHIRECDSVVRESLTKLGKRGVLTPSVPITALAPVGDGRGLTGSRQGGSRRRERSTSSSQRSSGLLGTWPGWFPGCPHPFSGLVCVWRESPGWQGLLTRLPGQGCGPRSPLPDARSSVLFSLLASKPGLSVSSPFKVIKHRAQSQWRAWKV